jgi:signal transduction histidine kinase
VSNGIKYTSEGFVKVKSEISVDGNKVVFKVIDTGVGIETES